MKEIAFLQVFDVAESSANQSHVYRNLIAFLFQPLPLLLYMKFQSCFHSVLPCLAQCSARYK